MNALEQLGQHTVIVADTGDLKAIREFVPRDATTNPTLIYKAAQEPECHEWLESAVSTSHNEEEVLETLLVRFGSEILKIIPGRVSTEVDARFSFDTQATVEQAQRLIKRYEQRGNSRERVLIKIAATWEGIQAAKILEKEKIHCNLTLLFSMTQAVACANAEVKLISPFVGRIYDWHVRQGTVFTPETDPGVLSVRAIYEYYKAVGVSTEIMGASFRSAAQILALSGCDLLTISPNLLKELKGTQGEVQRKLLPLRTDERPKTLTESEFRWQLNQDAMASEKLAEGIRLFAADTENLKKVIRSI